MCGICGCSHTHHSGKLQPLDGKIRPVIKTGTTNQYTHNPDNSRWVQVELDVLAKNNAYAQQNRQFFQDEHIFTLNLVSSPGAGKTTLLVETIKQINLAQIVTAIDGDSVFTSCGLGIDHCSEDHPCPLYSKFKAIRAELASMLVNTNLEELALGIKSGDSFLRQ
jgi:hypothetical protein